MRTLTVPWQNMHLVFLNLCIMHIYEWLKVLLYNIMVILFGIDQREITNNPINDF